MKLAVTQHRGPRSSCKKRRKSEFCTRLTVLFNRSCTVSRTKFKQLIMSAQANIRESRGFRIPCTHKGMQGQYIPNLSSPWDPWGPKLRDIGEPQGAYNVSLRDIQGYFACSALACLSMTHFTPWNLYWQLFWLPSLASDTPLSFDYQPGIRFSVTSWQEEANQWRWVWSRCVVSRSCDSRLKLFK